MNPIDWLRKRFGVERTTAKIPGIIGYIVALGPRHLGSCSIHQGAQRNGPFWVPAKGAVCDCQGPYMYEMCKEIADSSGGAGVCDQVHRLLEWERLRARLHQMTSLDEESMLAMSQSEYEDWLERSEVLALREEVDHARRRVYLYGTK